MHLPATPMRPAPATTASGARDFGLSPAAGLPFGEPVLPIEPGHVYGLAELIDIAQTANPQTRDVVGASLPSGARRRDHEGALLCLSSPPPRSAVTSTSPTPGRSPVSPPLSTSGDVHGTVSGVAMQWLLFDFGERDALTRAAKERSFASNIAFNGTHQKIIYDVSRAFYDYTSARQRVAIARQSKIESVRLRDAAHAKLTQGVGTTVETAQADQLSVQAAFDLVQAEGGERDAYHTLLAAVGITPATRIAVQDVSGRPLQPASMAPIERLSRRGHRVAPGHPGRLRRGARGARGHHRGAGGIPAQSLSFRIRDTHLTGNLNVTSLPSVGSITQGSLLGRRAQYLDEPEQRHRARRHLDPPLRWRGARCRRQARALADRRCGGRGRAAAAILYQVLWRVTRVGLNEAAKAAGAS